MYRFESSPLGMVICAEGAVDGAMCGALEDAVACAGRGRQRVVVSLEACERIDAGAIDALARMHARHGDGVLIAVVAESAIHRQLASSALRDALLVVPTVVADPVAYARDLRPRRARDVRRPSPARRRRDARRSVQA